MQGQNMLKRRLFTLLALSGVTLFAMPASQVLATPATPGFHAAVNLPGSNGGSEPSLTISNNGTRYTSWQSPGEFANSADGFNFAQPATPIPDSGAAGDVTNAISYSGALYNGQICGLPTELHSCIYRSLNGGATWTTQNQLADNHPGGLGPAVDRRVPEKQHDYDGLGSEQGPGLSRVPHVLAR